jgi:hypothetical protein
MMVILIFAILGAVIGLLLARNHNRFNDQIRVIDAKSQKPGHSLPINDLVFHLYNNTKKAIQGFDMQVTVKDDMDNTLAYMQINWYANPKPFIPGGHIDAIVSGSMRIDDAKGLGRKLKFQTRIDKILYADGTLETDWTQLF